MTWTPDLGEIVSRRQAILDGLKEYFPGSRCVHGHVSVRPCNTSQNSANRGAQRNSKTSVKGVRAHGERFVASIMVKQQPIHLGVFETIEEAAAAYRVAAIEAFGEFARSA
jgi:hypothetical protein